MLLTGKDGHVVAVCVIEEVVDELFFSLKAVKDIHVNAVDER